MKIIAMIVSIAVALVVFAGLVFVLYGRERTWVLLSGTNDPGRYDFSAARRSRTANDALACSPGACTKPDRTLATYGLAPARLIEQLAARLTRTDPLARRVDDRSDPNYARFVTFSPIMRFPDAIDLEATGAGDDRSALLVYSRAKLGSTDFGKNRTRIDKLIDGFDP